LRRRTLRSAVLPLATLLLAACHVGQHPRPDVVSPDSAARADIAATRDAYMEAVRSGDADRIASFFSAEARLAGSHSAALVGASAIRDAREAERAGGTGVLEVTMDTEVVHVAGTQAFEFGEITERLPPTEEETGLEERLVRSHYTIHWQRGAEARWRIRRFLLSPGDG
jgi:ketosteroid isomerase-like protein